jgi:hypothetical protein
MLYPLSYGGPRRAYRAGAGRPTAYASDVSKRNTKPASAAERERRLRAERLLGGLLPDQTRDESGDAWGERDGAESRDDEIQRDVPPHHGS